MLFKMADKSQGPQTRPRGNMMLVTKDDVNNPDTKRAALQRCQC